MLNSEIIMAFRKYTGFVSYDEAGVEGFSSGVGVAVICSVAIMGLTLNEFLPLDGLFIMIPFLLTEAILSDVC